MASRTVCSVRLPCVGRLIGRSHLTRYTAFQRRFIRSLSFGAELPSRISSNREQWASASRWRQYMYYRLYSSSASGENGEEGEGEEGESEDESEEGLRGDEVRKGLHQQYALAPVSIPDVFPEVPILPISRNPIFPKFVKMLEVRIGFEYVAIATFVTIETFSPIQISDAQLMNLLRRKVRLALPYAGAFLKKDDRYIHNIQSLK